MNKRTIIIAIIVILIVIAVIVAATTGNHSSSPTTVGSNNVQTQQPTGNGQPTATNPQSSSTAPASASYTSTKDGFSVNFPGIPQVTNTIFNSPSSGAIPLTQYKDISTGNAYYAVYVYHYPTNYQFSSTYLSLALKAFAAVVNIKYPGSVITSQASSQFLGNSAISAAISVKVTSGKTATTDNYILITTKGHNTYIIGTYGMTQDDYNKFQSSFAFTQ
jgi:hypothetical protein